MTRSNRRQAESLLEGAGDGPFFCLCCKEECELQVTDEGIGAYEYWGAKGTDVQLVLSSACCQDDFTEIDPKEEDDAACDAIIADLGDMGTNMLDKTKVDDVN